MVEHCAKRFNQVPDPTYLVDEWGFGDLAATGVTNIVFTNGLNDGWSAGSVVTNLSETLLAVNMPNGTGRTMKPLRRTRPHVPMSLFSLSLSLSIYLPVSHACALSLRECADCPSFSLSHTCAFSVAHQRICLSRWSAQVSSYDYFYADASFSLMMLVVHRFNALFIFFYT